MKISELTLEGFGRHLKTTINFGDATYLIGENNVGKSTVLRALKIMLSATKSLDLADYFSYNNGDSDGLNHVQQVRMTMRIDDLPAEASSWRGFRGRVFEENKQSGHTHFIVYRKTFPIGQSVVVEMKSRRFSYVGGVSGKEKSLADFAGYAALDKEDQARLLSELSSIDPKLVKITNKSRDEIEEIIDSYFPVRNYSDQVEWDKNPGGFQSNVVSRLPSYLYIPAADGEDDLSQKGALQNLLNEMFREVRDKSKNFAEAQIALDKLADELSPENKNSDFADLMSALQGVVTEVFSDVTINIAAELSQPDNAIKPSFDVKIGSNIQTDSKHQGTGIVRSIVFAFLRYNARRRLNNERPILVGFEEPELFLHPNAVNQMRSVIYDLAEKEGNQIICTTHSPLMIDLTRKPNQVLNHLTLIHIKPDDVDMNDPEEIKLICKNSKVRSQVINASSAFRMISQNDQQYVKMLLKMDDYINRAFCQKKVLIVEGDTEDIILRLSIDDMPENMRMNVLQNWQIVKARGKAAIISLVRYFEP
ncbi:AAA family ATPase [Lacticaseibacillus nasuensis]|uniref:AAA family ATPase n=1 Tax=Lacticaseibacillus nasuensis TaxID=944671 RepID=UPI0006D0C1AB|nr:AAA family ATPase [Lacticaseibacillus nasuensis]